MTFLDKLTELEYEHVKKLNTLRDLRRHERYFDYEVEEKIIEVLGELTSSLNEYMNEYMNDGWIKISDDSKIDGLYGLYFVTVQYKRLPPKYNQVKLAKYDCFYHTFVHSSNGRPFSKDVEIIAYMPYSNEFYPHPYINEGTMKERCLKDNDYSITR